ncbi:hypothetical protein MKX03_012297 [Papaver bracteatum]|nr:hypothetical protein MKX03_012297 [Papaver bracteatum]
MAKVHLSLSTFLVGFLLVLIVSDFGLVRGQSCDTEGSVRIESTCESSGLDACRTACSSISGVLSAVCKDDEDGETSTCTCCLNAA